jgi:hypothetical protein
LLVGILERRAPRAREITPPSMAKAFLTFKSFLIFLSFDIRLPRRSLSTRRRSPRRPKAIGEGGTFGSRLPRRSLGEGGSSASGAAESSDTEGKAAKGSGDRGGSRESFKSVVLRIRKSLVRARAEAGERSARESHE